MAEPGITLRQRAFSPRSATGCSPCKNARVKCREEKPSCQRCRRLGLSCVYVLRIARQKAVRVGPHESRPLLPAAPKSEPGAFPISSLSAFPRLTPQQALYYDHFRTRVVSKLCSQVPAGFWLRTVLRECTLDDIILDGAIGIGALAWVDNVRHGNLPLLRETRNDRNAESDGHYKVAIAYYTRALAKFRQRVSSRDATLKTRSILIFSLLFLVFELLQGDTRAADTLSASCFRVLKSDLLRGDSRCEPVIAARLDDEGVQDAEFLLVRLTVLHGLTSPIYPAAREAAQCFRLPSTFNLQVPSSSEPDIERFLMIWKRLWTLVSLWCLQISSMVATGDAARDQEMQKERQFLLNLTEQCRCVTQERLDNEANPMGQRLLEYALALGRLHPIMLSASANSVNDVWDHNIDTCLEIVELGWRFITEAAAIELSQSLIYDGPVPTLLQMIQGCRDRTLRDSATDLLTRLVTPLSSWEMKSLFLGTRGLVDLEERGRAPGGEISPAARYDWTHAEWSDDYQHFHCTYTAKSARHDNYRKVHRVLQFKDYGLA